MISWARPPSADCTQLQLIRNKFNLPQDETDGSLLFPVNWNVPGAPAPSLPALGDLSLYQSVGAATTYLDSGATAGLNYYSMFGWDNVNSLWIRCADLMAILPLDWGYGTRMYSLLPGAYQDRDLVLVDPYTPWPLNAQPGQPPLQRFLNLLGFELDFIRTELESLLSLSDGQNISGALLPLLGYEFGLRNEPEIGMQQYRSLVQNAIHLYKLKGSARGITDFSSILTSYPTLLAHHGYNVMLTLDDSVMATSTGTWQAWPPVNTRFPPPSGTNSGLTLTQNPNMLTGPTAVAGMTNPLEIINTQPGPPPYNNTGMAVKVTGASAADITTGAIPVLDFLSSVDGPGHITFTAQIFSPVTVRTVELSIWGDNGSGAPIPVGAAQTFTSTLHDWKQFTITGTVSFGTYRWIYPRVRVLGMAANEIHYFTLFMLWNCAQNKVGVNTPVYDYPRDLKIVLQPQASNLFANPLTTFPNGFDGWTNVVDPTSGINLLTAQQSSVEDGTTTGWGAGGGGTIANSTAQAFVGTHSLALTATGTADMDAFLTSVVAVVPGTLYTFTAWFRAATVGRSCFAIIQWQDSTHAVLSTSTGTLATDTATGWTAATCATNAPVNAAYANVLPYVSSPGGAGEIHYVDGMSFVVGLAVVTAGVAVVQVEPGDTTGQFAVNGTASLEVTPNPGGGVWGGTVSVFSATPPVPLGWFVDVNNDWFGGAHLGIGTNRRWFDPVNSWFFENNQYFGLGATMIGGDWFEQTQPPVNNNIVGFIPAPSQFFNVSIYARYMAVRSPSDALMQMGFRWYFPDGTWVEPSYDTITVTQSFTRYSYFAEAPRQVLTGIPASKFYTFFRFPNAQASDIFLLNSAMLTPGISAPQYFDTTLFPGNPDYVIDPRSGASYYYRRRAPRAARLNAEMNRWIPMGSTYTLIFGAGSVQPPLDPTTW